MALNPFYLVFLLYFLANLFATVQAVLNGGMDLDYQFFVLQPESLLVAFFVQTLSVLFICLVFWLCLKIKPKYSGARFGASWGWVLIFLQTSFMVFNFLMGINTAGSSARIEGGSLINYFFVVFQPDIFFILVAMGLVGGKFFHANAIIYLISMFLRGWMGGVFIVVILYFVRYYPVRLSSRNCFFVSVVLFIILCAMPVILSAKISMRGGMAVGDFFFGIPELVTLENYLHAFDYLLNRFQHVGHVALLYENARDLYASYAEGAFISYWLDGLLQYSLLKIFGLETVRLNTFIVEFIYGVEDPSWNTNPGLAGWLFILHERAVFLVLYVFLFIAVPFYFFARYAGIKYLILFGCLSLLYFFHGWFYAYFNFVFYGFLLVVIYRLNFRLNSFSSLAVKSGSDPDSGCDRSSKMT